MLGELLAPGRPVRDGLGGKGRALAQLVSAGYPVPATGVVTADAYRLAASHPVVSELVARITAGERVSADELLPDLVLLGVLLLAGALSQAVTGEIRVLLSEQVHRLAMHEILDVATEVDYEAYEETAFHDRLQRAAVAAALGRALNCHVKVLHLGEHTQTGTAEAAQEVRRLSAATDEGILEAIRHEQPGLIVLGSEELDIEQLLDAAKCSVLIVQDP